VSGPEFEFYGVTNQRVIVLKTVFPRTITSASVGALRIYGTRTRGLLRFGGSSGNGLQMLMPAEGFYGIDNPIDVGRLIQTYIAPQVFLEDHTK
jgi:hypothetical protein